MKTKLMMVVIAAASVAITQTCLAQNAREIISRNDSLYFQAFAKNNVFQFASQYAIDTWLMSWDTPALCGPEAAIDFFNINYKAGVRGGRLTTVDLVGDGETFMAETGLFQFVDGNNKILRNGTYITIWKKTSQGWKISKNSFHQ